MGVGRLGEQHMQHTAWLSPGLVSEQRSAARQCPVRPPAGSQSSSVATAHEQTLASACSVACMGRLASATAGRLPTGLAGVVTAAPATSQAHSPAG